ncbi:MAG: S16 family serine protease [Actinomycetota bacterium]
MATEDAIVVGGPHHAPATSRRRTAIVAVVVAVVVIGVWRTLTWPLDYFAFSPGSATPTVGLVDVVGSEAFPPEGELYFTTVSSRTVTVLDWIAAQFDPAIELRSTDEVLGGRTNDERREQNRAAMLSSQDVAEIVALRHLGFDVVEFLGASVVQVGEDTAADGVLEPGDVVVEAEGAAITTQIELVDAVRALEPGDELDLVVRDLDGAESETSVILGENDEGNALLGVSVVTDWAQVADPPVEVQIDAGSIGGPSAGLAWTLTILDVLTPGELTGENRVAVTGTMELDGTVGPIGGVVQKTFAVREQGIDVFIVPSVDAPDAESVAGDDVLIVGVDNLDDALAALDELGGNALALEAPGELAAGVDEPQG